MLRTGVGGLKLTAVAVGIAAAYLVSFPRPPEPTPWQPATTGEVREPAPWQPATVGEVREALFNELQTVTLKNCTLKRYGNAYDGGYLMCANLASGTESAYSYGIGGEDSWGCQISREFGVIIHQYDCFSTDLSKCDGGRFAFHDECVGPRAETVDRRPFDTIASQIARNGDSHKRLMVKIDVEGAEWDALMATPDAVLDRIVQMPMELHGIDEVKFVDVVRRLKRQFYLVNLHFNNHTCNATIAPFPALAFQVLWVNKRVGVLDPDGPSPAPMSPLNARDKPDYGDCQALPAP